MPTIEFLPSPAGSGKRVEVPEGGSLLDICDEYLAPIPFSCRSATCATCQVDVLEGAELLVAPAAAERDLLELVGGPKTSRLACQAEVKPGPGLIRIRSLDGG